MKENEKLKIVLPKEGNALVYKYWLLMRGMVENYCPEVKLNPGLLFTEARMAEVNIGQGWVLLRV